MKVLLVFLKVNVNIKVRNNNDFTLFYIYVNYSRLLKTIKFMKMFIKNNYSLMNAINKNEHIVLHIVKSENEIKTIKYFLNKKIKYFT